MDEQRSDIFQLAVVILQIICQRNYQISHSSIKHSLPLTQSVDQQLVAARAVSPVLESLLRSCLSPNVHARPSADHILASLRALTQAPLYAKAKAWMRMGTDAAALLAKDSEKVDHNLAADLAQLRADNDALRKELEISQQSVQTKVREEIRLAQEFLEQRNDELRNETRKRQQFQSSYFTAKAEKEISEQERSKLSAELQAAQETVAKLLQRDKRARTLLEETRNNLIQQHDSERAAMNLQLVQSAANVASLQQRVELLLEKNGRLEERLVNVSDDCAALRQRTERQEQELRRLQESGAAECAATSSIKDVLATAQHELEVHRAENAALNTSMVQLRGLVKVTRCLQRFILKFHFLSEGLLSAHIEPKGVQPCAFLGSGTAVQCLCCIVSVCHFTISLATKGCARGCWSDACTRCSC
jgi:chromosome segregation ATPase